MYQVEARPLGHYDVAVAGGGIAGVCAAVAAARNGVKVILIESAGCLGGTVTEGLMGNLCDYLNKNGGILQELRDFLDQRNMTCVQFGPRTDENGKYYPGRLLDVEGCKYFFDKICAEAGVKVLFHSRVCHADHTNGHIHSLLLCTECGNYSVSADVYIDATGNGSLAALVGCQWECGEPETGRPNPGSMQMMFTGMADDFDGTIRNTELQEKLKKEKEKLGIKTTGGDGMKIVRYPDKNTWGSGINFVYDVMPDDIESLSRGVYEGRKEVFETAEKFKQLPGFENMRLNKTDAHIGIREGRRIFGEYRISNEDILEGRRFEDGVVLVCMPVDVHKMGKRDVDDPNRGYKAKPYHIPYRAMLPLGSDNMLLAGRCISGDFYPFGSYRVIPNMAGVGEAAGYAASICVKEGIGPKQVDGRQVAAYTPGYQNEPEA